MVTLTNQPTNQSINQPTNQSINQSINHSNQSINQSINQHKLGMVILEQPQSKGLNAPEVKIFYLVGET